MPRGLLIAFAAVLVVGVAAFEGLRSNRWGQTEDMKAATARLERVPREFGDWVGVDSQMDRKILQVAEATGYVSRTYTNRKTGEMIDMLLLCGPSGPIGAHTPDVCYGGLGYTCIGTPTAKRITLGDGTTTFWTGHFEKKNPADDPLRVYWAWGVDGDWQAAENPRTEFAMNGALYKLYLVHRDMPNDREPTAKFFPEFLPLVKTALTPDPG